MKKIATAIAISAIALAFVPASADTRTVEGSILAPAPKTPAVAEAEEPATLYTRQARCAYLLGGADSQGLVGHVVEISDSEWDAPFTLTADAGDPDVVFYADLGTCDNAPAATTVGEASATGSEAGSIPEDTTHAIIVNSGAANTTFTFTIG